MEYPLLKIIYASVLTMICLTTVSGISIASGTILNSTGNGATITFSTDKNVDIINISSNCVYLSGGDLKNSIEYCTASTEKDINQFEISSSGGSSFGGTRLINETNQQNQNNQSNASTDSTSLTEDILSKYSLKWIIAIGIILFVFILVIIIFIVKIARI